MPSAPVLQHPPATRKQWQRTAIAFCPPPAYAGPSRMAVLAARLALPRPPRFHRPVARVSSAARHTILRNELAGLLHTWPLPSASARPTITPPPSRKAVRSPKTYDSAKRTRRPTRYRYAAAIHPVGMKQRVSGERSSAVCLSHSMCLIAQWRLHRKSRLCTRRFRPFRRRARAVRRPFAASAPTYVRRYRRPFHPRIPCRSALQRTFALSLGISSPGGPPFAPSVRTSSPRRPRRSPCIVTIHRFRVVPAPIHPPAVESDFLP